MRDRSREAALGDFTANNAKWGGGRPLAGGGSFSGDRAGGDRGLHCSCRQDCCWQAMFRTTANAPAPDPPPAIDLGATHGRSTGNSPAIRRSGSSTSHAVLAARTNATMRTVAGVGRAQVHSRPYGPWRRNSGVCGTALRWSRCWTARSPENDPPQSPAGPPPRWSAANLRGMKPRKSAAYSPRGCVQPRRRSCGTHEAVPTERRWSRAGRAGTPCHRSRLPPRLQGRTLILRRHAG